MRMICGIVLAQLEWRRLEGSAKKNLPPDIFVLSQFAVSTDDNFSHFFGKILSKLLLIFLHTCMILIKN